MNKLLCTDENAHLFCCLQEYFVTVNQDTVTRHRYMGQRCQEPSIRNLVLNMVRVCIRCRCADLYLSVASVV